MLKLHPSFGVNPTIPICFVCGKEKNETVLLGNSYRNKAPKNMCLNDEPCDQCKEYMKQGIILISVKDNDKDCRTGNWCVIKEESFIKIFGKTKSRIVFIADTIWDKVGLPRARN